MTIDEARAIALSFPESSEGSHHGHPDFRVGKTLFATLRPREGRSAVCLPPPLALSLGKDRPETFRAMPSTERSGWVDVNLTQIEPDEYRELVELAHAAAVERKKRKP